MPLAWECPDGSVWVMLIVDKVLERDRLPGETTDDAVMRLGERDRKKIPALAGASPLLIKTADLPPNRARRHAWRVKNGKIHVDPAVPDPPGRP